MAQMKRLLAYASSLVLAIWPVLAQVPETAEDFQNTYHVNSSLDNIIHYSLNPILRALGWNATSIIGDGVTDNCTPLNAALQTGPVHLQRPASITGFYRSSCTIIVPHGSALYGEGLVSDWPSGIVGGVEIRCDNGVMICVQLGDNVNIGNKTGEISRIKAGRAGASAPAGSVGFKLVGGFTPHLTNVMSDNHDICYLLKTPPGTGSGIAAYFDKLHTGRCTDVHVWNDSFPEVRIIHSRFGMSGGVSNAYMRMSCSQRNCTGPGAPAGWFVSNSQFNSDNLVGTLFDFVNASDNSAQFFSGDWGEVKMSDVHAEFINHAFQSDGTFYQIKDVSLANNTVATIGSFFNLNTNTNLWRWSLTGNTLASGAASSLAMAASASVANIQDFTWTGGNWSGDLTITGAGAATMYISNVSFANALTVNGSFAAFNEVGDNIAGTYTEAITGLGSPPNVTILNNRKIKHTGVTGVTCGSVSAGTLTSWNGIITHC
jgi:hypothetical protein